MTHDEKTKDETSQELLKKLLLEEIDQSVPFIVLSPEQLAALKALGEDV